MTERNPLGMTFAQARLLLRLISCPGASLVIESREQPDYSAGPSFHGFFYLPACSSCGHARREAIHWSPIHALAEAGFIKATWGNTYDKVTYAGHAAAIKARAKWPRMVVPGEMMPR